MTVKQLNVSNRREAYAAIRRCEPGNLCSLIRDAHEPVLLLGAGASVTSGIPLAGEVAERAARWAWCLANARSPHDQQVVRSDWWRWLTSHTWFDENENIADLYPAVIDQLLGIRDRRREFFQDLVAPKVRPSEGYNSLASMLHEGWITTVLTTNFDQRLEEAKALLGRPHHIVSMRTNTDLIQFSTAPRAPQLVYLHGSIDHYSDKNLVQEVQTLDRALVSRLIPLLRDHPLIVIGYRGAEPSIMRELLLDNVATVNGFLHGIYWCVRGEPDTAALPPMVLELASRIGSNFQLVPIRGFDELLTDVMWRPLAAANARPLRRGQVLPPPGASFDMQPMPRGSAEALDWALLRTRMEQYAAQLGLKVPDTPDRRWAEGEAQQRHLTVAHEGAILPTCAGWLLFAAKPQSDIPAARITFSATGPNAWIRRVFGEDAAPSDKSGSDVCLERTIEGNLWTQLDTLSDLLALLNQAFRLKGEVSKTVYPYDPLALKEVIVNAIVHRDYQTTDYVNIQALPDRIVVTSPGGIIAEVRAQIHTETLEQVIRGGRRGIKGYRNPVISDLFYGGGQMDRRGSGLSDVVQRMRANGSEVQFGADESNSQFEVTLFARPEAVDEITNTASPVEVQTIRFAANMLPILALPQHVWHAGTPITSIRTLREAIDQNVLPPCYLSEGRLFSFYNLEVIASDRANVVDVNDVEILGTDEFLKQPNGERALVQLLNDALGEHLNSIGLIVERGRRRAYFPKDENGEKQITYQGRARRAVRTVAKARTRRNSTDVIYWEHKAFSWQWMSFGEQWAVIVNPGYAFTKDGRRKALGRDRINVLSTRRAARDYNQNVHQDVTFWAAVITMGEDAPVALKAVFAEGGAVPEIIIGNRAPVALVSAPAFARSPDADLPDPELEDLERELEELAIETDEVDDDA